LQNRKSKLSYSIAIGYVEDQKHHNMLKDNIWSYNWICIWKI